MPEPILATDSVSKSFGGLRAVENVSLSVQAGTFHSIIGPNVAIGNDAIVQSSIISNSIIGSFSHLDYVVLHDSIIGNDSALKGLRQSLNIGDNTEINFQ